MSANFVRNPSEMDRLASVQSDQNSVPLGVIILIGVCASVFIIFIIIGIVIWFCCYSRPNKSGPQQPLVSGGANTQGYQSVDKSSESSKTSKSKIETSGKSVSLKRKAVPYSPIKLEQKLSNNTINEEKSDHSDKESIKSNESVVK